MRETSPKQDAKSLQFSAGADNNCFDNNEPVGRPPDFMGRSVAWRGQAPIVDRFWAKVNKNGPIPAHRHALGPCWLWTGCVVARYGQIGIGHPSTPGSKRWKTHRFSWELHRGPIPEHLRVCHDCDNPLCVNPAHLFLGTQKENVHDSSRKGRKNAWGIQKLNADDVRVIRAQVARGILQKDIAKAFGIAKNTVSQIVHRKTWAHLPEVVSQEEVA